MSESNLFTKESLLKYTSENNNRNIIVIHENVYDVTEFMDEVYIFLTVYFNYIHLNKI